jgi:hypothetical protein
MRKRKKRLSWQWVWEHVKQDVFVSLIVQITIVVIEVEAYE